MADFDLDKLYNEEGFYQGHLGQLKEERIRINFGGLGNPVTVIAKDLEYKGQEVIVGKAYPITPKKVTVKGKTPRHK